MYKLIKASDGSEICMVDSVTYIKKNDNYDCYIPTEKETAIGVVDRDGNVYNLAGYDTIEDAETAIVVEINTADEFMSATEMAAAFDEGVNSI